MILNYLEEEILMKKKIALALVLILALSILGGCKEKESETKESVATSTKEDKKQSEVKDSDEPVHISILTRWSDESPQAKIYREQLEVFRQENPQIILEDLSISDETSFNDKWKTSVATGRVPSVFANYGCAVNQQYAENKVMLDLSKYLDGDKQWAGDITASLFNNWKFDGIDGIYGVPYEYGTIGLFYNKSLFKEYNLTPPKTMNELTECAAVFMDNGIIPIALGAKDNWRGGHLFNHLLMKSLGAEGVRNLANRSIAYTDEEVVSIFSQIEEMNSKGFFGGNALSKDYGKEKADFHDGKAAMRFDGSWYLGEAKEAANTDQIGVIEFPYYDDKEEFKTHGFGGAFAGLSVCGTLNSGEEEAAVKLVKFLTSKEYFTKLQEAGGVTFPVKLTLPESATDVEREYAKSGDNITEFYGDVQNYDPLPELLDTTRNAIQGLFAGMSPEEVANQIQEVINSRE